MNDPFGLFHPRSQAKWLHQVEFAYTCIHNIRNPLQTSSSPTSHKHSLPGCLSPPNAARNKAFETTLSSAHEKPCSRTTLDALPNVAASVVKTAHQNFPHGRRKSGLQSVGLEARFGGFSALGFEVGCRRKLELTVLDVNVLLK